MKLTIEHLIRQALRVLQQSGSISSNMSVQWDVARTKKASPGDYGTNVAFVLAKSDGRSPKTMALLLMPILSVHPAVERIEVVGPGFINFFMKTPDRVQILSTILAVDNGGSYLKGLVQSESNNMVFHTIQYAIARIDGLFRQLDAFHLNWSTALGLLNTHFLVASSESVLFLLLSDYPALIEGFYIQKKTQQVVGYMYELANGLHSYYNAVPLVCEQKELRNARLCLLKAVRQVLCDGVQLLGVSVPESM